MRCTFSKLITLALQRTAKNVEIQPTELEKITHQIRDLYTNCIKNSYNSTIKKTNNLIRAKDLNRLFSKCLITTRKAAQCHESLGKCQ